MRNSKEDIKFFKTIVGKKIRWFNWPAGSYFIPKYLKDGKPEGCVVEFADCIIRIADFCHVKGWDLEAAIKEKMEYNKTRPHKHGGKKF
jgi:hypothetical protein